MMMECSVGWVISLMVLMLSIGMIVGKMNAEIRQMLEREKERKEKKVFDPDEEG